MVYNISVDDFKSVDILSLYQVKELIPEMKIKIAILEDRLSHWEKTNNSHDFVSEQEMVKNYNYLKDLILAEQTKKTNYSTATYPEHSVNNYMKEHHNDFYD